MLVHGYLGDAESWTKSGVISALEQYGYRLNGAYFYSPQGLVFRGRQETTSKPIYSVSLPSQAPAVIQADWLIHYLENIQQRHPKETITLVGHSAGGVVARLCLVRHQPGQVTHLITIAAPHQGTTRATQALDALDNGGMFGMVKGWLVRRHVGNQLYQTLQQSQGILYDLSPPQPGNLLFWLNQQTHPAIHYTSIIRTGNDLQPGDTLVPPVSQDLRLIPALAGKAKSYTSQLNHSLGWQDGAVIARLAEKIKANVELPAGLSTQK